MTETGSIFAYRLEDKVYINLTNACCNSCDFCLRKTGDGVAESTLWLCRPPEEGEVLAQIDSIEKSGFNYTEAVFCGYGEPTYEISELIEIAKELKKRGKTVRLNTNGLGNLINCSNIVPPLAGVLDSVSVSLNAPDPFQYQANCHCIYGLKSYDAIVKFSRACVKAGIKTTLTVLDILPYTEIQKCRETARKIKADFKVRQYIADNYNYERRQKNNIIELGDIKPQKQ